MNNHDLYKSNRKSEDIVYLYTNGETDRYIKTEEGIILVHTNAKGGKTTSLLPATVMSVEEFDALKKHSDESYENMAGSDYLEERNCTSVISFDEASIADTEESPEERMIREMDEMEHPSIETWENAMKILDCCGLSELQKQRYILHFYGGKTSREIASIEGVSHRAIVYSLDGAQKRIEKFKKFILRAKNYFPKPPIFANR